MPFKYSQRDHFQSGISLCLDKGSNMHSMGVSLRDDKESTGVAVVDIKSKLELHVRIRLINHA
jgi:hypothetical protein